MARHEILHFFIIQIKNQFRREGLDPDEFDEGEQEELADLL